MRRILKRAIYLLKKSDKSDFIRLFKSDFIQLFKIRSTALIWSLHLKLVIILSGKRFELKILDYWNVTINDINILIGKSILAKYLWTFEYFDWEKYSGKVPLDFQIFWWGRVFWENTSGLPKLMTTWWRWWKSSMWPEQMNGDAQLHVKKDELKE